MSLFSSLQLAGNALSVSQIALQVTGNNIANANTPGYIRQEALLTPGPTQRFGGVLLGTGVQVDAIVQKSDAFLEERLRTATSDLLNAEKQEEVHLELETLVGELSDTDLSTSLSNFFGSINDVVNQPNNFAVRNLAVLRGQTLTDDINRLSSRALQLREHLNDQIEQESDSINRLLQEIADLNVRIVTTEGGDTTASDAVGLRDQRIEALTSLAELIDIKAIEQTSGAVNVYAGGDYLVAEGTHRSVSLQSNSDGAINANYLTIEETDSPLQSSSGLIAGLTAARDEIVGGFISRLDEFTQTLVYEFNKLYASGQGAVGHQQLTSEFAVSDATAPLDNAGLAFLPENGSFQVQVRDQQTGQIRTTDIYVELTGLENDASLDSLAASLDAVDGIAAEVTEDRQLSITSDSETLEFNFAHDTSGVLAALGLGTFFTGSTSSGIGVHGDVQADPLKFATSRNGIGADTEVALELAAFLDRPLEAAGGATLAQEYDRFTGATTQAAAVSRSVAEGFRVFQSALEGQKLAVSGVNLDEEAIKMISMQRAYQASARYISTVNELLGILVNL